MDKNLMTELPESTRRKLGLVIDLDTCVGCHACVVNCKEWNTSNYGSPLSDIDAYGSNPVGTFLNRIHTYEVTPQIGPAQTVHFPKSCLHCEDAPCVTVCPTGASYKRVEDGIVLVNESDCIGCGLCAWACPYGARELDLAEGVMKKCTLCVDRIYNENIPEEDREPACVRTCPANARHFGDFADPESNVSILTKERGGLDLMPEQSTKPVNKYLPPRPKADILTDGDIDILSPFLNPIASEPVGFLSWVDNFYNFVRFRFWVVYLSGHWATYSNRMGSIFFIFFSLWIFYNWLAQLHFSSWESTKIFKSV